MTSLSDLIGSANIPVSQISVQIPRALHAGDVIHPALENSGLVYETTLWLGANYSCVYSVYVAMAKCRETTVYNSLPHVYKQS